MLGKMYRNEHIQFEQRLKRIVGAAILGLRTFKMTSGGCRKHGGGQYQKLHPKFRHLVYRKWKGHDRLYVLFASEVTSILKSVFGPYPKEMKFQFKIVDD